MRKQAICSLDTDQLVTATDRVLHGRARKMRPRPRPRRWLDETTAVIRRHVDHLTRGLVLAAWAVWLATAAGLVVYSGCARPNDSGVTELSTVPIALGQPATST